MEQPKGDPTNNPGHKHALTTSPPSFSPVEPLDGRALGDWRSIYSALDAQRGIKFDAWYMAVLLMATPILMVVLWLEYPKYLLGISDRKYAPILKYGLVWLSGVLGGTLFDTKWLYHSVAKKIWHLDRRLWRLFTPHLSGALSVAIVWLISSGLLPLFSRNAVQYKSQVMGIAFLVGYFSDSAIAKLTEIAETLFGAKCTRDDRDAESAMATRGSGGLAAQLEGASCEQEGI